MKTSPCPDQPQPRCGEAPFGAHYRHPVLLPCPAFPYNKARGFTTTTSTQM